MNIQVGDVLMLKKQHPCGNNLFTVQRIGMDFKIQCNNCRRDLMIPRIKVEKSIKKVFRENREIDLKEL